MADKAVLSTPYGSDRTSVRRKWVFCRTANIGRGVARSEPMIARRQRQGGEPFLAGSRGDLGVATGTREAHRIPGLLRSPGDPRAASSPQAPHCRFPSRRRRRQSSWSQVYGGGGTPGATLRNDFIELFNRGATTVDLGNWSVQYGGTTGTSWSRTNLSGTLAPGQYYLVQGGSWRSRDVEPTDSRRVGHNQPERDRRQGRPRQQPDDDRGRDDLPDGPLGRRSRRLRSRHQLLRGPGAHCRPLEHDRGHPQGERPHRYRRQRQRTSPSEPNPRNTASPLNPLVTPPVVTLDPVNQTVNAGSLATFAAAATGSPARRSSGSGAPTGHELGRRPGRDEHHSYIHRCRVADRFTLPRRLQQLGRDGDPRLRRRSLSSTPRS